jgi:MFS family permease
MKKNRIPKTVIMLGLVSLFTDAASEMIYPLIPVFVSTLGAGAAILGVIEGVAESTASLLKFFSGYLSDKTGRRKIFVIAGYAVSSLFRPLTGLVTAAWQIILIRMADRIGKGIRTAPRDALIASAADEKIRGRAFGFHRAMDHTGAVIGPILATVTLLILFLGFSVKDPLLALRLTFLFAFIPGILAVLTIIFFVSEKTTLKTGNTLPVLSAGNFDRNFRRYLLIVILFTLGNSSDAFLLFRVEEAIKKSGAVTDFVNSIGPLSSMLDGFGSETARNTVINILFLPFIWAFFHVIKVIFSTPLGALSDKIGRKKVINAGWGIYAIVYFGFALLTFFPGKTQLPLTFMLFAVYALYFCFTEGAEKAFVADLVSEQHRGTAYGIFNFAIGLGALPASIIFGALYGWTDSLFPGYGGTIAFGFGGVIALASMLLLYYQVEEKRRV